MPSDKNSNILIIILTILGNKHLKKLFRISVTIPISQPGPLLLNVCTVAASA
jgi:hypothetical protein